MEKKQKTEKVSEVVDKALQVGKSAAVGISKGTKELAEKAKRDKIERQIRKYNPLFLDEYKSENFYLPNIICIVDDAVRRDIDVCKGAIGWKANKKGTEVLYLYDEFVGQSGIIFVPSAVCDEIYYADSFDRRRFIKLDCVFSQSHDEKMAELEHIAYSLGAKSCSIQIEEEEVTHERKKRSTHVKEGGYGVKVTERYEGELTGHSSIRLAGRSETVFKGNDTVVQPTLKWFAHDNHILNLIDYRINKKNEVTSKVLELQGVSSATMSKKTACSIDAAVGDMGVNQSTSMEDKTAQESRRKLIFKVEF